MLKWWSDYWTVRRKEETKPGASVASVSMRCFQTFLVSMCLILAGGIWAVPANAATDLGFRFYSASATVTNNTTNYGLYVSAAASDWNQNTDLVVSQGSGGNINFWEGSYGATGWDGGAEPYNGDNQPCVDWPSLQVNGNCNTTDHKAAYAYIYFNTYYGPYFMPAYGAKHEIGHVFGLGHVGCAANSIMEDGSCRPDVPTTLQADEKNQINAWY